MARLDTITHRARSLIGPLLIAAVLAYIGFHSIQGERGFLTWLKLSNQIEQTRLVLDESRAEESRPVSSAITPLGSMPRASIWPWSR